MYNVAERMYKTTDHNFRNLFHISFQAATHMHGDAIQVQGNKHDYILSLTCRDQIDSVQ